MTMSVMVRSGHAAFAGSNCNASHAASNSSMNDRAVIRIVSSLPCIN